MECKFSGKQIDKAGKFFLQNDYLLKDENAGEFNLVMDVLSNWRFCHETPLNEALQTLRKTVGYHDKTAIFAKRLKRYFSNQKKLKIHTKMTLRNMHDIGGCRAIVENEKKLRKSVRDLKRLSFFQTSSGNFRSKDYIKNPKDSGYRGYHLIGRFASKNQKPRNIEIQLRTRIQHYWATALEIVDLFTGQALKSNQGTKEWSKFFELVGQQFAIIDSIPIFKKLKNEEQQARYEDRILRSSTLRNSCYQTQEASKKLKIQRYFAAFAGSLEVVDKRIHESPDSAYVLLSVDFSAKELTTKVFSSENNKRAESEYINAEKAAAKKDDLVVALVSTSKVGGIKEAFPNFFADSTEFLSLINLINSVRIFRN